MHVNLIANANRADDRYGSNSALEAMSVHVRISPESGLVADIHGCLRSANCGLMRCNKPRKEHGAETYSNTSSASDQQYVGKF